jgi:hypothetical protein
MGFEIVTKSFCAFWGNFGEIVFFFPMIQKGHHPCKVMVNVLDVSFRSGDVPVSQDPLNGLR